MRQFREHFERINNEYYYSGEYYEYDGKEATFLKVRRGVILFDVIIVLFIVLSGLTLAGEIIEKWYIILLYMLEIIAGYFVVRESFTLLSDKTKLKGTTVNKTLPNLKLAIGALAIFSVLGLISAVVFVIVFNSYFYANLYLIIKILSALTSAGYFRFISSISCILYQEK